MNDYYNSLNKVIDEIEKNVVINKFNLQVNNNQHVAIVGKTGSGKSTIVNMLCRFYNPTKGEILINNRNIILSY